MDIKAIVCPNCGASATNFHNCEYCGSFLVQRAHEGVDLTDYMRSSSKYVNESILQEVKKFMEFVKNNPDSGYSLSLEYKDRDVISLSSNQSFKDDFDLEIPGVCITLIPTEFEGVLDEIRTERFENSSLYNTFKKVSAFEDDERLPSEIPWNECQYYVDFGFDYQGAALVVSQFLEDVIQLKYEYVTYNLYDDSEHEHLLCYSPNNADNIDFDSFASDTEDTISAYNEESGISESFDIGKIKKWIWIAVAALGFLLWLLL